MPIINWPRNFSFELSPLEFFNFILSKSSTKPNAPKPKDTKTNVQKYLFKSSCLHSQIVCPKYQK